MLPQKYDNSLCKKKVVYKVEKNSGMESGIMDVRRKRDREIEIKMDEGLDMLPA